MKTFMSLFFLSVTGVCLVLQLPGQCVGTNSPILIVPGLTGSQLEVEDSNFVCSPSWLKPSKLLTQAFCEEKELSLVYDDKTGLFHDNPNGKIVVPGFGKTSSVETLNRDAWFSWTRFKYMHDLVEFFVAQGYVRDVSIRAAPYDWRLAADELENRGYFNQLKRLVEDMYKENGNTKVTLVVHSMGGLVSLHFLTGRELYGINQAWKDQYINAYIPLNVPWEGAVPALQTALSGTRGKIASVPVANTMIANYVAPLVRSFESIPWLLPQESTWGDEMIVRAQTRQYSVKNLDQLFKDVGYVNGFKVYEKLQGINQGLPFPNVPTLALFGSNVPTPESLIADKVFTPQNIIGTPFQINYGGGDGSVNARSLEACLKWSKMSTKVNFHHQIFTNVNHNGILSNPNVLGTILKIARKGWPSG